MQRIEVIDFRGTLYRDERSAIKAVDDLIGKIITTHAHRLVHLTKYSEIVEYLESSLADFHEAYLLEEDKRIINEND